MKRILWHDSETTGLTPKDNQMLSYAMVATDENCNIIDTLYLKIKVMMHIIPNEEALRVNRIDPFGLEWAAEAVTEEVAAKMIDAFIEKHKGEETYSCAYNAAFDNRFVIDCMVRNNLTAGLSRLKSSVCIDPMQIAKGATKRDLVATPMTKYGRSNKLEHVSKALGTQHQGEAHNALNDVMTLIKTAPVLYKKLTGQDFVHALTDDRCHIPFHSEKK